MRWLKCKVYGPKRSTSVWLAGVVDPSVPPPSSGLTREDVIRAREAWRRSASLTWKTLLDAPVVNEPKP